MAIITGNPVPKLVLNIGGVFENEQRGDILHSCYLHCAIIK